MLCYETKCFMIRKSSKLQYVGLYGQGIQREEIKISKGKEGVFKLFQSSSHIIFQISLHKLTFSSLITFYFASQNGKRLLTFGHFG